MCIRDRIKRSGFTDDFAVKLTVAANQFIAHRQSTGYDLSLIHICAGTAITDDLSGNLLQQVTRGASMMGMFVIG